MISNLPVREKPEMITYGMIAYILLCIVGGLTAFTQLNQSGRTWSAILFLILFVLIAVFFGMRWFSEDSTKPYKGVWPPIINMCPDYLVFFKRPDGKGSCIDMLGVNRSGGTLKAWAQDDSINNPPADEAKYFNYVYKPGLPEKELKTLCMAAQNAGLTWEGITNGESCTYVEPERVATA